MNLVFLRFASIIKIFFFHSSSSTLAYKEDNIQLIYFLIVNWSIKYFIFNPTKMSIVLIVNVEKFFNYWKFSLSSLSIFILSFLLRVIKHLFVVDLWHFSVYFSFIRFLNWVKLIFCLWGVLNWRILDLVFINNDFDLLIRIDFIELKIWRTECFFTWKR